MYWTQQYCVSSSLYLYNYYQARLLNTSVSNWDFDKCCSFQTVHGHHQISLLLIGVRILSTLKYHQEPIKGDKLRGNAKRRGRSYTFHAVKFNQQYLWNSSIERKEATFTTCGSSEPIDLPVHRSIHPSIHHLYLFILPGTCKGVGWGVFLQSFHTRGGMHPGEVNSPLQSKTETADHVPTH